MCYQLRSPMSSRPDVVVVTGGSRGIGASVVRRAAESGRKVCFTYLEDELSANELVLSIANRGGHATATQADISREHDVLALFKKARELGEIKGLVANAGIVAPPARLVDFEVERVRKLLSVNVLGTILCCREAVRHMSTGEGGNGGSIVLVSSAASRIGSAGEYVDYAATKGAVDTLGLGLSQEVAGEGIRVNVVRPGTTSTQIHERNGQPKRVREMDQKVPLGRAALPDEVADAVLWLLSDEASYCVGSFLDVSGGR